MTFKITRLDTIDTGTMEKVVKTVHMEIHKDGKKLYVPVPLSEPGKDFTVFEDLTEEQVVHWCKTILGEEKVQELESRLEERVNEVGTIPISPPWESPIGLEDNEA